jgi:hypothetical protein
VQVYKGVQSDSSRLYTIIRPLRAERRHTCEARSRVAYGFVAATSPKSLGISTRTLHENR